MDKLKNYKRYMGLSGILSPFLVFLFTILSIILHPWFNFSDYAFSHLGELGVPLNFIFNLGLILGGISGLIFSIGLYYSIKNKLSQIGVFSFSIGMISFIILGLFPMGMFIHKPSAALFYLFTIFGILFITLGELKRDKILSPFLIFTIIICISLLGFLTVDSHGLGLATIETIAFIPVFEFKIAYGAKLIYE